MDSAAASQCTDCASLRIHSQAETKTMRPAAGRSCLQQQQKWGRERVGLLRSASSSGGAKTPASDSSKPNHPRSRARERTRKRTGEAIKRSKGGEMAERSKSIGKRKRGRGMASEQNRTALGGAQSNALQRKLCASRPSLSPPISGAQICPAKQKRARLSSCDAIPALGPLKKSPKGPAFWFKFKCQPAVLS